MLRTEFHCHTIYSKDSLTRPEALVAAARRRGLDRVIVTDHNSITGALEAQRQDPERIIIGEEIMTRQGELLAAFVQEELPAGLEAAEAIARLREQDAFISVSHPFDHTRSGHWDLRDLEAITPLVDAIEIFNSRCLLQSSNEQAQTFARQRGLKGTVGSDAHAVFELGRATLLLPDFNSAAELKAVLSRAQPSLKLSSPWVHLYSRFAVWKKKIF